MVFVPLFLLWCQNGCNAARSTGTLDAAEPDTPLHDRALPGLTVALPDWEVREHVPTAPSGTLVVSAPTDEKQEIKIVWRQGQILSNQEAAEVFNGLTGRDALRRTVPTEVAGLRSDTLLFELDAGPLATTQWTCPDDPRAFTLFSFLQMPHDDLLALHRRMLESVRCEPLPQGALDPLLPVVEVEGMTRVDDPHGLVYAAPNGDLMLFGIAPGGTESIAKVGDGEQLYRVMLRSMQFEVGPRGLEFLESVGPHRRPAVHAAVRDITNGEASHAAFTFWSCPSEGQLFFGLYLSAEPPTDAMLKTLTSARCPTSAA